MHHEDERVPAGRMNSPSDVPLTVGFTFPVRRGLAARSYSPAWPLICTTASSLPDGTDWPALTTSDEPTSTLNGVLNVLMMLTSSALPAAVNMIGWGALVPWPAGTGGIVPIGLAIGSLGLITVIGATYTVNSGVS